MQRRIEENYAKEMSKTLEKRFNKKSASLLSIFSNKKKQVEFTIEVEGVGVHWHCLIKKKGSKKRYVKVHCTEIDRRDITNPDYKGIMYDVAFYENDEHFITGRAFKKEEALKSVEDWFQEIVADKLYWKYEFIDNKKKQLNQYLEKINLVAPELQKKCSTFIVEKKDWSERLLVELNERSCEGYFWRYEDNPRIIFKWNETKIFEHSDKNSELVANLINDWVLNISMPSRLGTKYKDVNFGKLGSYYEKGKGIEGEFILSWDSIEEFYGELSDEWHPFKEDALKLIREMRNEGLDKKLRAGQSLFFFMLSRARRHGLRDNHPYLHITFMGENKMKINSNLDKDKDKEDVESEVKYQGYIKELTEKLLIEKIE